jgi:hypothetical protein
MGFLGLGRSPLKHVDPRRREQAVRDLPVAEQGTLIELALGDADPGVRLAAAIKVREPEFLAHLARHKDEAVAKIARDRLANVAVETIKGRKLAAAKPLLAEVHEQSALVTISLQAEDPAVRDAAFERLTKLPEPSEKLLGTVAIQEEGGRYGVQVLARIEKRQVLKDIAKKAKNADLRKKAAARIEALDAEAKRPKPEKQRRERLRKLNQLVERAEGLTQSRDWQGGTAGFARVDIDYREIISAYPELDLDEACSDASAAIARARGRFDAARNDALEAAAAKAAAATAGPNGPAVAESEDDPEPQAIETAASPVPAAPAAPPVELDAAAQAKLEAVLAEAERLSESNDWKDSDYRFKELDKEWRVHLGDLGKDDPRRLAFMDAYQRFKERRRTDRERRDVEREQRLEKMRALCTEADALAATEPAAAELEAHAAALKDLQARWKAVGAVPPSKVAELRKRFRAACDQAYLPVKALHEARDWERFNNVPKAEDLIARAEALAGSEDLEALHQAVKALQAEWKEVGPLPRERKDQLWDQFKTACDRVYEALQPLFAQRDEQRQAALETKEALIARLQAVLDEQVIGLAGSPAERDAQARKLETVQAMQAEWKAAGPAPREHDQGLWKRYKALLDRFYAARREHNQVLDQERVENLNAKLALCSAAVELAEDAERYQSGQPVGRKSEPDFMREVKDIQRQFRETGHVPRERHAEVRDRFKAACDRVYAVLEPWFEKQDSERAANLEIKQALIKELEELLEEERPDWFKDEVKAIQQKWRDAGQVPRKDMGINDQFRDLCDRIFAKAES